MGKYNVKKMVMNDFYCTQCGAKAPAVWRKKGAEREAGHLKKLFCLHCQAETNHVECREWDGYTHEDFLVEFEHHNFTPDGQRVMSYGELRGLINNGQA